MVGGGVGVVGAAVFKYAPHFLQKMSSFATTSPRFGHVEFSSVNFFQSSLMKILLLEMR